jgi:hypothetical protein
MKRPSESDYTSHVAYTRALEEYCDWLVQPAQEPCGWQFYQDGKWHNGMETNNHRANTERAGIPVRDVYPAPQRKPLTDEQRQELMSKAWNKWLSRKDDGRLFAWDFSFEVEAAHGIKEDT